jgi:hypothetical protein
LNDEEFRMNKTMRVILMIFITTASGIMLSCTGDLPQTGTLEGTVTIGPIWPVERPGENLLVPAEVFEARRIMIYDGSGKSLVEQVDILQIDQSQVGHYSVQLRAGSYVIDINNIGMDRSAEVPQEVKIKTGQTIKLDIDIDTGIR